MTVESERDGHGVTPTHEIANGTAEKRPEEDVTNDEIGFDALSSRFDDLVKTGGLFYDYDFVTETHSVDGLDFEFRISAALRNKPFSTSDSSAGALFKGTGPRPGSDINIQGLEVDSPRIPESHFIAFNGFACYRPHLLIMTADGFRRQWEPLDLDDFTTVAALLDSVPPEDRGTERDFLVFFNCRAEAGCSRLHKHMQAIPRQSLDGEPWRNLDRASVPFAFHRDDSCGTDPKRLLRAYAEGMAAVERTLGEETELERGVPPHNVVLDRDRLVVIPRRAAGIEGLGANSGGMLGLIWTQSEAMMQRWLDANPHKLLEAAGVPELL